MQFWVRKNLERYDNLDYDYDYDNDNDRGGFLVDVCNLFANPPYASPQEHG